ncbi:uncharacterized protein LOC132725870 [Ruditapes philippinarum]|uniref:uncharacterized protein LOC132725870 n=1 Tax=Ruditapes philippinarum TaxID=129788 RepID=UPI00295AAF77|nr:uncharacterized protein LOC132725870 [Ruditapes philippinarum]
MGASNSAVADNDAYIAKHLKDIEFNIGVSEVEFIQTGVETLLADIVNDIAEHQEDDVDKMKTDWIENIRASCSHYLKDKLKLKEQHTTEKLIKIGSFYEGTKNYYPDSFDFIYIVGIFETIGMSAISLFLQSKGKDFVSVFRALLCRQIFSEPDKYVIKSSKCQLKFDSIYEEGTDSATSIKLQFEYKNEIGHKHEIRVNLYPAFKVNDSFLTVETLQQNDICSSLPDFNRFIVETSSFVIMNFSKISFAETELRFINDVISPHHRVVYKFVKHLINGNDKDDRLKKFCSGCIHNVNISSRRIKTELIAHHFTCRDMTHSNESRHVQACAKEIILDLAFQVEACRKRCVVRSKCGRDKWLSDVNVWYNQWTETPESNDFRNFGSNYLGILGNSLNPGPVTSLMYRFYNIDKCYSQYMLDNRFEFFQDKPPDYFGTDELKWYFSVGKIRG